MSSDSPASSRPLRRWPGVLLSLLIPGFGLLRARQPRRALLWFLGLHITSLLAALFLVAESIPLYPVTALLPLLVTSGLHITCACDSFRPGRMTWKLSLLFLILVITSLSLPLPAKLIARAFQISSYNMEPTLIGAHPDSSQDQILINRISYLITSPQRGDLITFATSHIPGIFPDGRQPKEEVYYVIRIVGLPGETIEIKNGRVHANGIPLGPADGLPPIHYLDLASLFTSGTQNESPRPLGPAEYYVLGDNTRRSSDSRFWGPIPAAAIYGKVTKIYYPLNRMGTPAYPSSPTPVRETPVPGS